MMGKVTILGLIAIMSLSFAADELYLKVKIESYDPETGTATALDLENSCYGERIFLKGIDKDMAKKLMLKKEVFVMINSPICEGDKTYEVIYIER